MTLRLTDVEGTFLPAFITLYISCGGVAFGGLFGCPRPLPYCPLNPKERQGR